MQRSRAGATVITGATGFVGGELLVKLLRESSRTLICPIRANSFTAAVERGEQRLRDLVGDVDAIAYTPRVTWLRADIEEAHLGWSDMRWHDVASRTTEIFHCAASVSFDLPLDAADRINVAGTQHVYALAQAAAARHDDFQRFHHVSTAFVAGVASGRVDANFLPPDRASAYRNTYERTKARAERYLRSQACSRVPVTIHRPSIIAGNSRTGATTNWNVLYVPMKMAARGVLPVFTRGGRQIVDAVAVDYLVNAMVTFSQLDSKPLEAHHVTAGARPFTVTELLRTTNEHAELRDGFRSSNTRLLNPTAWKIFAAVVRAATHIPGSKNSVRRKARIAKRCIHQCSVYLSYSNVDVIFDSAREQDLLRVFGVEMPSGPDYLETVIGYALATKFGRVETDATDLAAA